MKAFMATTIAACALACAFAALPARSAGPATKPTPTPVAIAYDEINRNVMAPATAPPPGSFQADYQLAMQAAPSNVGAESGSAATPTPAPKKHGLGAFMSTISNPMGAAGGNQGEAGPGGPQGGPPGMSGNPGMMNMMQYGHVVRYTWYWSKNWVREDDPVAQTAVIHKCPQHQEIHLDLKAKTYTIVDTSSGGCVNEGSGQPSYPGQRMGPGTVDMNLQTTSESLGPKTLEGIATNGDKYTMQMSMSNATGSCQNGQFAMLRVAYVSNIGKPRPYCPLTLGNASGGFMGGGCKPTFHTSSSGSNPMDPDKLEMYLMMQAGQSTAQLGGFSQVTERGHIDWYYKPQADPLFEPPPDFTKAN